MQPFSIRHGKALTEQRMRVSMKDRLRARLWMTVQKHNETYSYYPDPSDNWRSDTNLIEQADFKLKRLLGLPELKVKARDAEDVVGIEGYFMKGYPSCALEVIEQFVEEVARFGDSGKENAVRFQAEVNEAMVALSVHGASPPVDSFKSMPPFSKKKSSKRAKICYASADSRALTMNLGKPGRIFLTERRKMSFSKHSKVSRAL